MSDNIPDVCLLLEGTYPYVQGGVSTWVHDLLKAQSHLKFCVVSIMPPDAKLVYKYDIPPNVVGIDTILLQKLPPGEERLPKGETERIFREIEMPLLTLQSNSSPELLERIVKPLIQYRSQLGSRILLNSEEAWKMLIRMYNATMGDTSFLDYFWTWRALVGGLYSLMLAPLPKAKLYHSLCTGYAGLFMARAHLATQKPCIITEHGIYTNERRIEIASADWLEDQKMYNLSIQKHLYSRDLKDFWIDTFAGYSRLCYAACSVIITLFEGNQEFQLMDGADAHKLRVIPNGIDYEYFSAIPRDNNHPPTIALIGRVVPIKDVKTFIRAIDVLRNNVTDLKAYVIGPQDEDKEYYEECVEMVHTLKLQDTIEFTGKVSVADYLPKIDVVVLSSISEAQPLVILEVGAAGIPMVATDVGACREMVLGRHGEAPALGAGGAICPLANPKAIAMEAEPLLIDPEYRKRCGDAARERIRRYYNKKDQHATYAGIYRDLIERGK